MSEVVRNVRMLLMFFVLRAFVAVLSKNVSTEVKDTTKAGSVYEDQCFHDHFTGGPHQ